MTHARFATEIRDELRVEGHPSMMSACEAARAMRCSKRTVWRYAESGRLTRVTRSSGAVFFRLAECAELLAGLR